MCMVSTRLFVQETQMTSDLWSVPHTAPGGQRSHGKRLSSDGEIKHTQTCQSAVLCNTQTPPVTLRIAC